MAKEELIKLSRNDAGVWLLRMQSSPKHNGKSFENCFNPEFIQAFHQALDTIENDMSEDCALVTTSSGSVYSTGIDINYLATQEVDVQLNFMKTFQDLLKRLLTFPMPTVAAINGHAFAGGFLLSLAHDYRVMNSEKGFCCMNEVDMGVVITPPLNTFIKSKLPRRLAAKIMLEGCRLNAQQLEVEKVIDDACPADEVTERALSIADSQASKGGNGGYHEMKQMMYEDAVHALSLSESKL